MSDPDINENTKNDKIQDLTAEKNKIFSVMPRFAIMLILNSNKRAKISDLAKTLNLTTGNLDHHLRALEEQNLIVKKMDLFQKKFYTTVQITKSGKDSFSKYLNLLKDILD